jgi:hypothetical protein
MMNRPPSRSNDAMVELVCQPTVERLQLVLDGEASIGTVECDPHVQACPRCRDRILVARTLVREVEAPSLVARNPHLTDRILLAIQLDRRIRARRRRWGLVGTLAAVIAGIVIWSNWPAGSPTDLDQARTQGPIQLPNNPATETEPTRPVRIGAELAKAGEALRGPARPSPQQAESPSMLAKITNTFTRPAEGLQAIDPAPIALAEFTDAARIGLQPVTGTAQKAFNRFLRDIGAVQGTAKPKS